MNVNITNGDYGYDKYEDIKEDYINSPLSCRKLQIKHNVSVSIWNQIIKDIKKETGYSRRPGGYRDKSIPKYYYFNRNTGKYDIVRQNNGKSVYFGHYVSSKDAERVVEELKKCDWDKDQLPAIRESLGL